MTERRLPVKLKITTMVPPVGCDGGDPVAGSHDVWIGKTAPFGLLALASFQGVLNHFHDLLFGQRAVFSWEFEGVPRPNVQRAVLLADAMTRLEFALLGGLRVRAVVLAQPSGAPRLITTCFLRKQQEMGDAPGYHTVVCQIYHQWVQTLTPLEALGVTHDYERMLRIGLRSLYRGNDLPMPPSVYAWQPRQTGAAIQRRDTLLVPILPRVVRVPSPDGEE